MIDGVVITKLKIISDHRGRVMHMLRSDNPVFKTFGEIYFSTVFKNIVKGWHLHKQSFLNYTCMHGNVKLVLMDKRESSKTFDLTQEIILSPENYQLVTIPPNVWNGFKGLSEEESIIANCLSIPHNEDEMVRKDHNDNYFKYKW
jgi:dTDP-4-dehydrorhamnose 3,5-epimerase